MMENGQMDTEMIPRSPATRPSTCRQIYSTFFRPVIVEFIASFFHVFIAIVSGVSSDLLAAAFGAGLSLFIAISISCDISGGHVNPIVSFGIFLSGGISFDLMVAYVVSQLVGGVAASGIAKALVNETALSARWATVHFSAEHQNAQQAVLTEVLLGAFLVILVYKTVMDIDGSNFLGPFIIGSFLTAAIIAAGPLSGAGINPARCFGAAAVFDDWTDLWVYFVGPFTGATAAGILHRLLLANQRIKPPKLSSLRVLVAPYVDIEEIGEERQSDNNRESTF